MDKRKKKNAPLGRASLDSDSAGGRGSAAKQKGLDCGVDSITKVVWAVHDAGLALRSSSGKSQLAMLPEVLKFRGTKGINTLEGMALGYFRIATRVKELKEQFDIITLREDVVAPDGLAHKQVARYVLLGKRKDIQEPQQRLPLEVSP